MVIMCPPIVTTCPLWSSHGPRGPSARHLLPQSPQCYGASTNSLPWGPGPQRTFADNYLHQARVVPRVLGVPVRATTDKGSEQKAPT
jgi:hypothetical protein